MDKVKISPLEFGILTVMHSIGTSILILPSDLAADAKQSAWISVIVGVALSALLLYLYNSISRLYPDVPFTKTMELAFGKWIGRVLSLFFTYFCFFSSITLIWVTGNFTVTQMLPETPMVYVNILFTAVLIYGVRLGLETISRAAEILIPWVIMFFLAVIVFSTPNLNVENLQPLIEVDMNSILRGSLSFVSIFSLPLVVLLMVHPISINKPREGRRAFFIGMLLAGFMMLVITLYSIAVLGSEFTIRNMYPIYVLAKKISIGNFLERMEAIIAGLWIVTIFFKAVIFFYGAVSSLGHLFKLKDYRPITLPLGIIMAVYSLVIYPDVAYAATWDNKTWMPITIIFGFLLPLFVFAAGKLKKSSTAKK